MRDDGCFLLSRISWDCDLADSTKPKVISEALGHASVAFTMDTYSHIIDGMQQDAMELLDDVLPEGFLKNSVADLSWDCHI